MSTRLCRKGSPQNVGYLRKHNNFWGYLFVAPQIIGLLSFTLIPVLITIYLCFADWDFINPPRWVNFENFVAVFSDEVFHKTIGNTVFFVIGIVPLTMVLALFLAVMADRKIKFVGFFKAALFLPMVTSTIAIALVWYWIYAPDFGLVNLGLEALGINGPGWLEDPAWTKPAIVLMSVWRGVGYSFLLFLASLKGVPSVYYEAAEIDGANAWQRFYAITWPMISPITFFILVTSLVSTFGIFNEPYMLTNGGPMYSSYTMMLYLYNYAFKFMKMGQAAVVSIFMAVLQIGIAIVQFKFSNRWVNYDT